MENGILEEESSISDLEEIQKVVTIMKDNYLHILFDRDHLINLIEMYRCAIEEDEYEIDIISHELKPVIP